MNERSRRVLSISMDMLLRVVAAAYQGTALHETETARKAFLAEAREPIGMDEFDHGQVLLRGLQVLTEREHVAPNAAQIVHGLEHFVVLLAEAEHHAALRAQTGLLRAHEHFEA